jgi:hypothetical protein
MIQPNLRPATPATDFAVLASSAAVYRAVAGWRPSVGHTGVMRITIRVRPGSARPGVGGEHDGALVVRVGARAVGGQATAAAMTAVAAAFGVRRRCVTLVSGGSSRTKIVDIAGADPAVLDRLLGL